MFTFPRSFDFHLIVVSSFWLLFGCDNNYIIENHDATPLTQKQFYQLPGYKLDYDLYLPNSYTGWEPTSDNKFSYDAENQMYVLQNLDISHPPIDDFGERFKITSVDWQHEFGFTNTNSYIEESKFGLVKNTEFIFNIKYFSVLADAKDMFFELPSDANPALLHVKVKIISDKSPAKGLMLISYDEQ